MLYKNTAIKDGHTSNNTNSHLKSDSKMGRFKADHALRSAEDSPLGQILIPTHKDGICYNNINQIYQIMPATGMDNCFDYLAGNYPNLAIGDIVEIPFGRQRLTGVILSKSQNSNFTKLKAITDHIPPYNLSSKLIKFLDFFARYNLVKQGLAYRMIINYAVKLESDISFLSFGYKNLNSTPKRLLIAKYFQEKSNIEVDQVTSDLKLTKSYIREQIKAGFLIETKQKSPFNYPKQAFSFNPAKLSNLQQGSLLEMQKIFQTKKEKACVLNGVTGSGKTEIYLEYVREKLAQSSGQIVILVPEIILTKQLHTKILERFNLDVPTWHSLTSKKNKQKIWNGINSGNIRIIIGTRSALMLPFKQLDLIILDEEHDSSYKQEDNGVYHARDMAVARAKFEGSEIILASATPSLESLVNVDLGKYHKIDLATRFQESSMPKINIIDMRKYDLVKNHFISPPAIKAIKHSLDQGEQSLIYLNRRGFAPIKICNSCGYKFECPNCSIYLVEHKRSHKLHCHHCEYHIENPTKCLKCHHPDLISFGPGIERILEEVRKIFPNKKSVIISSETSEKDFSEIINQMKQKEIDIIIGTQIIAKGHHFPDLTNVTVIDGDLNSNEINNLRCSEKLYQLLNQIAGRAGREAKAGNVYIQSFEPENPLLQAIASYDNAGLIAIEKEQRKAFDLPPYSRFLAIIIADKNENNAKEAANYIAFNLPRFKDVQILGPIPAPLYYLRQQYRYRILIKAKIDKNIQSFVKEFFKENKVKSTTSIKLDVDPYNFF
ncbi:MAG: primosomal protein N' [Rickettsiales bacterium]|jgi:primosomal protein N' (replication factor Y) (superfamily II helicase)|nr:primosomal protein N' [Rickettsiales bacterium]